MPDDYGNIKGISVPAAAWDRIFGAPREHVVVVAGELMGRSGTVTKTDGDVWVLLDHDTEDQVPFKPGELRRSAGENETP